MLIAIEGIDGSGKSTQTQNLCRWLRTKGLSVAPFKMTLFHSPGYRYYEQRLRNLTVLTPEIRAQLEARLITLDTVAAAQETVVTQMVDYEHVVCDRYTLGGQALITAIGVDTSEYLQAVRLLPQADVTFHFALPFETALRRMHAKGERFSEDELELLVDIHAELERLSERTDCIRVDASSSSSEVFHTLRVHLSDIVEIHAHSS